MWGFGLRVFKSMFPDLVWEMPNEPNAVFLTFDDGPNPATTPWILDTLCKHNAKATFFCLGKNVEQHPAMFDLIGQGGCAVGNHTYSHQKGWGMSTGHYVEDIDLADRYIHSRLFRPPYSRIGPNQMRMVSERYTIIMWSLISMDYSRHISRTACANLVINNARPGSIIVFHDSLKAFDNLRYALPAALDFFAAQGWEMKSIEI
jgi:peptidoglycan/xylan/chitin deacetylase (PgdA/CDA1 family)